MQEPRDGSLPLHPRHVAHELVVEVVDVLEHHEGDRQVGDPVAQRERGRVGDRDGLGVGVGRGEAGQGR